MEFARKQLEKYGWTDGKGLGKNENGISEALKPKLKRSVAGIGHDAASDFTEHWWTTLYDKAAGNVQVKKKKGKIEKIETNDTDFQITNSTWKLNMKPKKGCAEGQYTEHFVKKSVLTNGGSNMDKVEGETSDSEPEIEKKDVNKMTDEELFAACGGRTAHKGARHGLKASGKLARIEMQEQLLLQQSKFKDYSISKKQNVELGMCDNDMEVKEKISLNSEHTANGKKKIKKRKQCHDYDTTCDNIEQSKQNIHTDMSEISDGIVCKNMVEEDECENIKFTNHIDTKIDKPKKKKKRKKDKK